MTQQDYEVSLLALTIWREASSEPINAKMAVAWSIRNRVSHPSWYGGTWAEVLTKRLQYSSMTAGGDPNLIRWPLASDLSWTDSMTVATSIHDAPPMMDPTNGATHYYSGDTKPSWASEMTHTLDSASFHFFKPA